MRLLFSSQPLVAHVRSLLPVALGARKLGHEVLWVSSPFVRAEIEAYNIPFAAGGYADREEIEQGIPEWESRPRVQDDWDSAAAYTASQVMAGAVARAMIPDLIGVVERFGPDVVVRDAMEYGGCLVAEAAGIPHVSVAADALSPRRWIEELTNQSLDELSSEFGLGVAGEIQFKHLHFEHFPLTFFGSPPDVPSVTHAVKHITMRSAAAPPEWVGLPRRRPLVLAAFGTLVGSTPGLCEAVIEGLRDEKVDLVLAAGSRERAEALDPRLPGVVVMASVPQTELLRHASVFVTHGGLTSLKEAFVEGVPVVVLPINGDQRYLASRCAHSGVGTAIDPSARTPEAVRSAVRTVLETARYSDAAKQLQAEMVGLPGLGHALRLLIGLS